ncbi:hypothetical protein [Streptomyces sp. NPDC006012]|uniref:hypothetical protein n=1 Tax=Streptomyces sp. NPDC006012 TaxID=3364739 RepID=UPI0036CE7BA3
MSRAPRDAHLRRDLRDRATCADTFSQKPPAAQKISATTITALNRANQGANKSR